MGKRDLASSQLRAHMTHSPDGNLRLSQNAKRAKFLERKGVLILTLIFEHSLALCGG